MKKIGFSILLLFNLITAIWAQENPLIGEFHSSSNSLIPSKYYLIIDDDFFIYKKAHLGDDIVIFNYTYDTNYIYLDTSTARTNKSEPSIDEHIFASIRKPIPYKISGDYLILTLDNGEKRLKTEESKKASRKSIVKNSAIAIGAVAATAIAITAITADNSSDDNSSSSANNTTSSFSRSDFEELADKIYAAAW